LPVAGALAGGPARWGGPILGSVYDIGVSLRDIDASLRTVIAGRHGRASYFRVVIFRAMAERDCSAAFARQRA
jgi:hypothetical protein